jgi:hypothetical protein
MLARRGKPSSVGVAPGPKGLAAPTNRPERACGSTSQRKAGLKGSAFPGFGVQAFGSARLARIWSSQSRFRQRFCRPFPIADPAGKPLASPCGRQVCGAAARERAFLRIEGCKAMGLGKTMLIGLAMLPALSLAACGVVHRFKGPEKGATTDKAAWTVSDQDPLSRPIQVAWTSARARYCGFIFSPQQLRSDFLASEERAGNTPAQMQKITQAYDYTFTSVMGTIQDEPNYCDKSRTDAIRSDLKHYLSGDFAHRAQPAS